MSAVSKALCMQLSQENIQPEDFGRGCRGSGSLQRCGLQINISGDLKQQVPELVSHVESP